MYSISVTPATRQFLITLEGSLSQEESQAYLTELEKELKRPDLATYSLVVDTSELKASSQDMLPQIKRGIELILHTPFQKRFNIVPKSAITNMQANRVGKEHQLDMANQMIPVKSLEEILSYK